MFETNRQFVFLTWGALGILQPRVLLFLFHRFGVCVFVRSSLCTSQGVTFSRTEAKAPFTPLASLASISIRIAMHKSSFLVHLPLKSMWNGEAPPMPRQRNQTPLNRRTQMPDDHNARWKIYNFSLILATVSRCFLLLFQRTTFCALCFGMCTADTFSCLLERFQMKLEKKMDNIIKVSNGRSIWGHIYIHIDVVSSEMSTTRLKVILIVFKLKKKT